MTGFEITYKRHVQLEFGEYVQAHEEHDNRYLDRTVGAICLGPSGNQTGTHWLLNLASGARMSRTRWTRLPMPRDVIARVNTLGRQQRMPVTLSFGDRFADEIPDNLSDFADDASDSDSDFVPDAPGNDDNSTDNDDNSLVDESVTSDNVNIFPDLPISENTGVGPAADLYNEAEDDEDEHGVEHDNEADDAYIDVQDDDDAASDAEEYDKDI